MPACSLLPFSPVVLGRLEVFSPRGGGGKGVRVKEPGLGEQGAAFCALGYQAGRNAASEGVSSVHGRQEEQSVPSVSLYLSEPGLVLPPPL